MLVVVDEINASRCERVRRSDSRGMRLLQFLDSFVTEKPDSFLGQTGSRISSGIIKDSAEGQRIGHALDLIPSRIENSASIIVSKPFGKTDLRESLNDIQHFSERVVELFRNREAVFACEESRVQEEIERIHVVVESLLKIDSVRTDLPFRLFQDDFPSPVSPAFCSRELRA